MIKPLRHLSFLSFYFMTAVVSLMAQPNIEWQNNYGGTESDRAYGITIADDGGYLVVGESQSQDGDVSSNKGNYDVWIVKLTEQGDIDWQKSYGGSGYDQANSVLNSGEDGGYIVSGYTTSTNGDISQNLGVTDYWVIKISEEGVLEWESTYGTQGDDFGRAVTMADDDGFVIVGSGTRPGTAVDREVMIIKFSDITAPMTL